VSSPGSPLRQPILSLLGHVDHGKTTLLDRIAGSVRAAGEAGGITQHIHALEVPRAAILRLAEGVLDPSRFVVPGLLVIDTPGHRSFETLRRRGGALADLAILVIDAREGVMPQTRESIQILRHEKTPFAVALTKIDLLPGWSRPEGKTSLAAHLQRSNPEFARSVDARVYSLAEELANLGFSAERFDRVSDFTRNVGIVPVSAKVGLGVPELLALLVGLSQRFLTGELALVTGVGEGTVLERTDLRGIGPVAAAIVYRGRLRVADEIVVTGRSGPFSTRVRGIYRPAPKGRGRGSSVSGRLESLNEVSAAAGIYVSAPGVENALPGGLIKGARTDREVEEARAELARAAQPVARFAESGVQLVADTLGGLEALAFECEDASIPVFAAEVGVVNRAMVLKMATVRDPAHRAVLAFNVPVLPDARPEPEAASPVRVFSGDVMYRIIEEYRGWRDETTAALTQRRRLETVYPAKFEVLPGFVFRSSKPAIVGVRVLKGQLRTGVRVMRGDGTEVGVLRGMQKEGVSQKEAPERTELAVSIDGAVVGRTLSEGDVLYVAVPEAAVRALRGAPLSDSERQVLDEVVRIRRATMGPFWGQ
jgi:translation initiation factor 5B